MSENQKPEDISRLLAKAVVQGLTDEERRIVDKWKDASEYNAGYYEYLTDPSSLSAGLGAIDDTDPTQALRQMTGMISKEKKRKRRRFFAVAAGAAAVVAGVVFVFNRHDAGVTAPPQALSGVMLTLEDGTDLLLDTLSTPIGQQGATISKAGEGSLTYDAAESRSVDATAYNVITVMHGRSVDVFLSDGTHVWLNAGSKLRFPVGFAGTLRKVELTGEAYFKVTPDPVRQFIVETPGQSVTVLGTEFNIHGYPGEPIYTTLVSGSICVESGRTRLTPMPGEQSIIYADGSGRTRQVDVTNDISWREGYLILENKPLEEILKGIERMYDVRFEYESGGLGSQTLNGRIPPGTTLEQTLSIISHSSSMEFSFADGYIRVSP